MSDDVYIPPGAGEREIAIRRRVHRQAEFWQHAMVYGAVNAGLWLLNGAMLLLSGEPMRLGNFWAIWPTLGWGIGLACHAVGALPAWGGPFSARWEERKVRELMSRRDA